MRDITTHRLFSPTVQEMLDNFLRDPLTRRYGNTISRAQPHIGTQQVMDPETGEYYTWDGYCICHRCGKPLKRYFGYCHSLSDCHRTRAYKKMLRTDGWNNLLERSWVEISPWTTSNSWKSAPLEQIYPEKSYGLCKECEKGMDDSSSRYRLPKYQDTERVRTIEIAWL